MCIAGYFLNFSFKVRWHNDPHEWVKRPELAVREEEVRHSLCRHRRAPLLATKTQITPRKNLIEFKLNRIVMFLEKFSNMKYIIRGSKNQIDSKYLTYFGANFAKRTQRFNPLRTTGFDHALVAGPRYWQTDLGQGQTHQYPQKVEKGRTHLWQYLLEIVPTLRGASYSLRHSCGAR